MRSGSARGDAVHDAAGGVPGAAARATAGRTTSWSARPIANRGAAETEGLIGFFVNTLVLRSRPLGGPDVPRAAAAGARRGAGGLRASGPAVREAGRGAAAGARPEPQPAVPGDVRRCRTRRRGAARCGGLRCRAAGAGGREREVRPDARREREPAGWAGVLEYSTDLFDAATIERHGRALQQLLAAIVADARPADRRAAAAERGRAARGCAEWNDTARPYPRGTGACTSCSRRRRRGRRRRWRSVCGDERLTYGELNARANQLAHHLRALGVGPERLVGLCLERSAEMIVALLGGAQGGRRLSCRSTRLSGRAARVHARGRRRAAVLTHERQLRGALPAGTRAGDPAWTRSADGDRRLSGDDRRDRGATAEQPGLRDLHVGLDRPPEGRVRSRTARSCGCVAEHRLCAVRRRATCSLQFAPVAFDASTFEIWGALLNGGASWC